MKKKQARKSRKYDLVVVGAGPGGYVAAIRAAQLGLDVACVEKQPELGGTCLRVGCIPSKALLEGSERFAEIASGSQQRFGVKVSGVELDLSGLMKHKQKVVDANTRGVSFLFEKNGIARLRGHGRLDGPGTVVVEGEDRMRLEAPHVLLATGSCASSLPGVELDGERIGTSDQAIAYPQVPKRLVVIGAGVIGLELGSVWARLGAEVTVLEFLPEILPGMDGETARLARKLLSKQGLRFRLGARVSAARAAEDGCVVEAEGIEPIACDRVLVAVGRKPYTEGLGLDTVGIETDRKGRIPVDEAFRTHAPGVYAIGDVIAGPMLAHKAEEEGVALVERLVTGFGHVDYEAIASVVYTDPEIASVGKSEEALAEAGIRYTKGVFPFAANGRARALARTHGQVKILADSTTDRVLGVHIIGPRAGDLIAEISLAVAFTASAEDIARCSHAHPTLAEAVKEAALAVDGRALHL